MIRSIFSRLIYKFAERIRNFFTGSTMLALENLRQEVRDLRTAVQSAVQSSAAISVDLPIIANQQHEHTSLSYIDAGTLHSFFCQWTYHNEILRQATLVVACPLTSDAARALLQPSEMLIINAPQDWDLIMSDRNYEVIALVGLDLINDALQSKSILYKIIRACRREILYLVKSDDKILQQRQVLHQIGFYEVSSVLSDGSTDNSTVGLSAKGDFILRGRQPVLTWPGGEWCLHRANRIGQTEGPIAYPWKSVLGNSLQVNNLGWTGTSDALSLCVYQGDGSSNTAIGCEQRVQAVMQWPLLSGEGHASLVGGYGGPGDAAMVLAMIQVDHTGAVSLSIWWHDDHEWQCLRSKQIQKQDCQHQEGYLSVLCWLHLTTDYIRAGCGKNEFLEVPVINRLKTTVSGLRIHGKHIAVKDFSVQMGNVNA